MALRKNIPVAIKGIRIRVSLLNDRTSAMALFPFILLNRRKKATDVLINHERIHLMQQLELLVVPFYLIYLFELLTKGYRNISFEKEAYANEKNLDYLKQRRWFAWLRH
jgi:hypothetical protein